MKFKLIFLILILASFNVKAQESEDRYFKHGISLIGSGVINPGITYSLVKDLPRTFSFGGLVYPRNNRTFSISGNVGMYWDPFSHMGLQNYYDVHVESNLIANIYFEYGAGLGFQARFTGDNYVVDEDFEVTRSGIQSHVYPMLDTFAGFKFKGKQERDAFYMRTHLFILGNYNGSFLPTFMLEIGKEF